MIRIKPGRCGYGGTNGYTCQRLPQLQEWMFNESNAFVSQMTAEFDKLPLRVKGMVFTEETIDMGWSEFGPHPEVPELSCRSNTDPASDATDVSVWGLTGIPVEVGNATAYPVYGGTSGWLDLFNSGYEITGGTQYFYHNISGTTAATSDVYIKVTGVEHEYHDIYLVSNIPTFRNGEQEMEMGPGLLEPMLDTDFAPVGIDTIPAWEAGLDADIFTNIVLNAWKGVIDDRIRNIYWRLNTLPAYDTDQKLRDLTAAENKDSECSNFQITLTSGSPVRDPDDVDANKHHAPTLPNADNTSTPITVGSTWHSKTVTAVWQDADTTWWWTVEEDPNLYAISGGEIAYGDNTISVAGLSGLYAPFYAYLMPSLDVTITHTDVKAADVPTVPVEGGTPRMIEDGDVLPSGGTVTGFTSSGSGTTLRYAWETVGDNTAEIVTKMGPQLTAEGTADPEPGGIGIGGVRIIQSDAESDPLVLYKIYHEDCISEIDKPEAEADAATAGWIRLSPVFPYGEELMDVEIPSGTEGVDPTVIGATAGIVQPVHNIQIHGSTDYRTQSPVDVPTVEAVYNFIHNYDDFADGEFEQASALATGSTMYVNGSAVNIYTKEVSGYTGSLAVPGTVIVATDIKTVLVVGKTVTASGCVPTAQAVVDYIAGLDLDGSTSSISGTLTVVAGTTTTEIEGETVTGNTYTEGWVTTDPATPVRGTVEVSKKIVVAADPDDRALSNQAVPSVNAIYEFMHSTELNVTDSGSTNYSGEYVQALVTAGTISDAGNNSGRETWNGIPGTVMVVKNVWMNTYHNLSASAVPSVEAVYKFIHGMTVSGEPMLSALATPGAITPVTGAGGTVSGYTAGTMGVFFVATAISYPASVYTVSVDGCVPSVQAVIDYVTSYVSGRTASLGYIQVISDSPYERVENASYGLVRLVKNIDYSISQHTDASATETAVPSAAAVYEFIHARYNATSQKATALATAGTISTTATTTGTGNNAVTTITGTTFTGGEPGTVEVSVNIEEYNGGSETGCVPTADAVVKYVHTQLAGTTAGYLEEESVGETLTDAVPGRASVSRNIVVSSDIGDRSGCVEAVPTVEAIYNFIHGYSVYAGNVTLDTTSALAVPVAMTASTTAPSLSNAIPGTMNVADTIEVDSTGTITAANCVPTAQAVVSYVATHGGTGGSMLYPNIRALSSVTGTVPSGGFGMTFLIPVEAGSEISVDNLGSAATVYASYASASDTTASPLGTGGATVGTDCYVRVSVIDPGTGDGCVRFVKNGYSMALYKAKNVQATTGSISVDGNGNETTAGNPGRVYIMTNVQFGSTPSVSPYAAPSVEAVYNFIHGDPATTGDNMRSALATAGATTVATSGDTVAALYGGTPGTFYVTNDMTVMGSTVTVYTDPQAVPTALAVAEYVRNYASSIGLSQSDSGTITVDSSSNEGWSTTDTPTRGTVEVSNVIKLSNVNNKRTISTEAVPTIEAVYNFIHTTDVNSTGLLARALASGSTMSVSGSAVSCSSTPGTVKVATDIKVGSGTTTVPDASVVVPTAQAVVNWVATHGSSAPVATVNNFSTAGLVYVTDYIPLTSSHPTVTVPTVDAVYSFVTGSSISGGLQYPNYSVLTNTNESSSGGTNLSPNTTYYVSGGGWLRVTVPSSSGCSCVTIDGSYNFGIGTPGGSGPMTWLIPVGPGHSFYVGTSASTGYVIKFDGICSQSGSSKSAGTTRALMKLNGISKYDPEDPESYEDTEEALMQKYGTTDTTGSQEDLEPISLLSQEAEANKNHVITQYEAVVDHTRMFVTNSSRSTLCAEHVEELCEEAAEYYDAAMAAKTLSEAQAWLAQGDAIKAAAYEWVGKTQAYGAAMTVLHNVDERTDYIELADGFIATAEERYDSTIAENENLLVIGVTGGAQFVDIAHRASQEAVQWKTKLEEEIENNATVYSRASSIASDAYATASGAYSKLEDKAQEASKYVSNLEKPQER